VRVAPKGGAVTVALALAREGLRVGLATVLADDAFGRRSVRRIAASGVDVGGVAFAAPRADVVVVDATGGARHLSTEQQPFAIPPRWSSRTLVLSGVSPVVSHAAAQCRAARAARRAGTLVIIDFDASLHLWAGHDPRTIRMILREVDVARCTIADLASIGVDMATVRSELREGGVLVQSSLEGGARAIGPFGEVVFEPKDARRSRSRGAGDAFTAIMCAELMRAGDPGESAAARWHRALGRAYAPRR
jgi:sugar/nucleoside kinase (ribokinase family)